MNLNFYGENGSFIKMLTTKSKGKKNSQKKNSDKKEIKRPSKLGKLSSNDIKNIAMGLDMLTRMTDEAFGVLKNQLLSGKYDVSRAKKELLGYEYVIYDLFKRLSVFTKKEYFTKKEIETLPEYYQILQAARDGVLLKTEKREETINGKKREVLYDTAISQKEALDILRKYEDLSEEIQYEKLNSYLGIGLGVAGLIGTIRGMNKNNEDSKNKGTSITIGTAVIGGLKLLKGTMKSDKKKERWELENEKMRKKFQLLGNEQVSNKAEMDEIANIEKLAKREKQFWNEIEDENFLFSVIVDMVAAVVMGFYLNEQLTIKGDGKIDGKSLSSALLSFSQSKQIANNLIRAMKDVQDNKKREINFEKLSEKLQNIIQQMEDKVYPLEMAEHPFNSICIKQLDGKFYPKMNYETGEIEYATRIKIPEFSMQRGDVVLLSGKSGSGKSTFFRLLKRGDINNRKSIQLDNGEKVDNLGNEYMSFRPSMNLGEEESVFRQITGKQNISDLDEDEKQRLIRIMKELKFDSPNLLTELATKKITEFSTGQQKRLALSKLFYRIDDGASIIIVDEPVGNVEEKLIKDQLKLIKEYAKQKNVMLLLTTHITDLPEDFANKRYHINKDGVLEQVHIKNKEREI